MRAGSGRRRVVTRLPGGCACRVSRGGPRGGLFHGFDGVEDTRTRHDLRSPAQPCPAAAQGWQLCPRQDASGTGPLQATAQGQSLLVIQSGRPGS